VSPLAVKVITWSAVVIAAAALAGKLLTFILAILYLF
jgi:hypothetical protein